MATPFPARRKTAYSRAKPASSSEPQARRPIARGAQPFLRLATIEFSLFGRPLAQPAISVKKPLKSAYALSKLVDEIPRAAGGRCSYFRGCGDTELCHTTRRELIR